MYRRILYGQRFIFAILLNIAVFYGCNDTDKVEQAVQRIGVDLKISRFDREFAEASPSDIPALRKTYPYLFPAQYPDSVWVAKLQDTLQIELLEEVQGVFANFDEQREGLENLFKHIKYYFPDYQVPEVVTLTSDVQYENRIILTDSLLLIGLDNYLGAEHEFYGNIQNYIKANLDEAYLISDVASAFAKRVVPKPENRSFLARMVYYGKELYLKDRLMPGSPDYLRIHYSEDELAWAEANEVPIWRNFIEREYLYSTDVKLSRRFLDPAPFSKFGLELDNESPGRIGRYIGWRVVRAFMDKNEVTLQQMLKLPSDEIFKKSNYKPAK
ncbi:gliding motility lipoprotein GldB [Pseudozobellia thermophila]|uniref:Protein involved in gliding motility GldB n=1 Tax=Pseudozobellia thermophila TaxID=192903 RepID=A0A1M6JKV7_9FLAO|nr:gliding motility lipoprotein GldB [Pseudozobellia thermophila]SHJ47320.1 protein involved in gliding motility GldB [Pseudozobellia thermophila]